jgi:GTPase SAR1 family protein
MNSNDIIQKSDSRNGRLCKTVVLLGSCEVGKTNILQQYTKKRFDENYMETIGTTNFIIFDF